MNRNHARRKRCRDTVEFFSSPAGVHTIGSPAKIRILGLLRSGIMPFDKIVADSGKAKSTVSVHLTDLERRGIIGSRPDPADARKKIFYIRSEYLGGASADECVVSDAWEKGHSRAVSLESEPSDLYRLIFSSIRVSLLQEGINIDPLLHSAGRTVGAAIQDVVMAPDPPTLLSNLSQFWAHHRLGNVEVLDTSPVILRITDCFECSNLPETGRPACAFEAGILAELFARFFGTEPDVTETACYTMGNQCCIFIIRKTSLP